MPRKLNRHTVVSNNILKYKSGFTFLTSSGKKKYNIFTVHNLHIANFLSYKKVPTIVSNLVYF